MQSKLKPSPTQAEEQLNNLIKDKTLLLVFKTSSVEDKFKKYKEELGWLGIEILHCSELGLQTGYSPEKTNTYGGNLEQKTSEEEILQLIKAASEKFPTHNPCIITEDSGLSIYFGESKEAKQQEAKFIEKVKELIKPLIR